MTRGSDKVSVYKPTVPHKINRELGLDTEHKYKGRRGGDSDDEGAAGRNAFGGSNSMPFAREDSPEDDTHAGPGAPPNPVPLYSPVTMYITWMRALSTIADADQHKCTSLHKLECSHLEYMMHQFRTHVGHVML